MSTTIEAVTAGRNFLDSVFGADPPGYAAVSYLNGSLKTEFYEGSEDAAARCIELANHHDVYFGVGRRYQPLEGGKRGGNSDVASVATLWLDVDVAGPNHKKNNLPPDRDAALALIAEFPLKPSIIVFTGGGYHGYWRFREPWVFDDEAERGRAQELANRLKVHFAKLAAVHGWKLDAVSDLSRILRVPGTYNRKDINHVVAVEVIQKNDVQYNPSDFDAVLDQAQPEPRPEPKPAAQPHEPKQEQQQASTKGFDGTDEQLIEAASGAENGPDFRKLWSGDTSGHGGDASAADLALANHLAFWCGPDPVRIDRLFRRSGLMRPKWDEKHFSNGDTYGAATVKKALQGRTEFYGPQYENVEPAEAEPAAADATWGESSNGATILIGVDEFRVADEVIDRLVEDRDIFTRGPVLVRSVTGHKHHRDSIKRPEGSTTIVAAGLPWLRERITKHVQLVRRVTKKKKMRETAAHPPGWLVQAIHARGDWPRFRELVAVVDTPILRPDGSVQEQAGYDAETGVLFIPTSTFPAVPVKATLDDAQMAVIRLMTLVGDFPFAATEHKSVWLAALLTVVGRYSFDGPAPCFVTDANTQGSGKTLLNHAAAIISTGRELSVCGYNRDSTEMAKSITSVAIAGDVAVLLDNLAGSFGNDALDRALTATRWKHRILGRLENVDLPLLVTWFATGNNVQIQSDTARRVLHIRLNAKVEHPEERSNFKIPNLLAWVKQNRAPLLIDAITILSAYSRAGRPKQVVVPFGSFEGWSDLVRSAVMWTGLPDPCDTRKGLQTADTTAETLDQVLAAWKLYDPSNDGLIITHLIAELYPRDHRPESAEAITMRAALELLTNATQPTAKTVGYRLRSYRGRVRNGEFLDTKNDENNKLGVKWKRFSVK